MSAPLAQAVLTAAAAVASFFFSGVETALVSCDRIRLRYLSERGSRPARLLLRLLVHPERLVSATLVGTNASNILASALATAIAIRLWGERGAGFAVPAFILLVIVFAEIFPKALFRAHADTLVLWTAYPLAAANWVLDPATRVLHRVSLWLAHASGAGPAARAARFTREELAHFLERSGRAGSAGRRWFRAVLGISERTVASVLVPIESLPHVVESDTAGEAARRLRAAGESFLIVRRDADGEPAGTVGVHDLLAAAPSARVGPLARPAPRVPARHRIEDLLPEIQAGAAPLAFVVSDAGDAGAGRVVGIVTHEAIAFAIVGTIEEAPAARVR